MTYGKGIAMHDKQIFGEYYAEQEPVNLEPLKIPMIKHNETGIRPCHDIYVGSGESGILTIKRLRKPSYGERWPVGGAVYRGYPLRESIEKTLEREIGIKTDGRPAIMLGNARILSNYDREESGIGMDSTVSVFYVEATDGLKIEDIMTDKDHTEPLFTTAEELTDDFWDSLHPYVRDFLPIAVEIYEERMGHINKFSRL